MTDPLRLDRTFDADYDVESMTELYGSADHVFHEPGVTPKPDLLLAVTTADGGSWTGGVRAGGLSAGSPNTGIYATPNTYRLLVVAQGTPT